MKDDFNVDSLFSPSEEVEEVTDDTIDTDSESEETSGDEENDVEEEGSEEEEEEDEQDLGDKFSQFADKLMDRISQLENKLQAVQNRDSTSNEIRVEDIESDFINDEVDLTSHEQLNTILKSVYVRAVNDILKSIPKIVDESVSRKAAQKASADHFYKQNPELKQHAPYVKVIAQELVNKNPNWTPDRLLSETAKVAKARLNIRSKASKKEKSRGGSTFAKGGKKSGSSNAGKIDDKLQQQLDELINRK